MKKHSKRYNELLKLYDKSKEYTIKDAIEIVKKLATAKFNETIDASIILGINPKKAEENVRETVVLTAGTGREVRVLVFAQGDKEKEAQAGGADYVGLNDYIEKIQQGWFEFDAIVATPDVMKVVSKLGKILGPKGLMPNPKLGTVTFEVAEAIKKLKSGQIEFKVDKYGVIKTYFGKASFSKEDLEKNLIALLKAVINAKPTTIASKFQYIKEVSISSTMSPGIKLQMSEVWSL